MLLLGERYEAEALQQLGVAWRVVPPEDLLSTAHDVASRLAALPPLASAAMKRVLNKTASTDLASALQLETEATVAGFLDPETTRLLTDFG
jgi:enoyl-CoA hydratase/carnithine racemase